MKWGLLIGFGALGIWMQPVTAQDASPPKHAHGFSIKITQEVISAPTKNLHYILRYENHSDTAHCIRHDDFDPRSYDAARMPRMTLNGTILPPVSPDGIIVALDENIEKNFYIVAPGADLSREGQTKEHYTIKYDALGALTLRYDIAVTECRALNADMPDIPFPSQLHDIENAEGSSLDSLAPQFGEWAKAGFVAAASASYELKPFPPQ